MTSWHERHDPENPENRNAGNGGDLVKHTIYLSALDYLLAHSPWERRAERSVAARRDCYRTLIQGETMAATPRLNTVIRALETGKIPVTVFAPPTVESAVALSAAPHDGIIFEAEHNPYDIK